MGSFLSMVFGGVTQILSEITSQLSRIAEEALSPINKIISSVTDGMWKGDGADAFVNELKTLFVPGITNVGTHVTNFSAHITSSVDKIQSADEAVASTVGKLEEAFSFF